MKVQLIEKPMIVTRGEVTVCVFPSRPYWFAASKEISVLLDNMIQETTEDDLVEATSKELGSAEEEISELYGDVKDLLIQSGLIKLDGKKLDVAQDVKPHSQIGNLEDVLVISCTQECNLECPHCYAGAKKAISNEMSTAEIKKVVDDLSKMPWQNDISRVGLTGGEFFIRKDALEIIDYIASLNFHIIISTNAILLNNDIIESLRAYPNLKVSVSLDGSTADSHEFIRGQGSFLPTINNISAMTKAGIFVGTNMFVHRINFDDLEATLRLAQTLGVKAFNCLNMLRIGRAKSKQSQIKLERVPLPELYGSLFGILKGNAELQKMMVNSTFANQFMGLVAGVKSHYCGIGSNRALYVKANGNVYPCPNSALSKFMLGNIKDASLSDIWDNSRILDKLRMLNVDTMNPKCAECSVRYFCAGGCRGENYQSSRSLTSPHINCEEFQQIAVDMMFMAAEDPSLFIDKIENLYAAVDTL